ncbi:hypothetical protein, partial [Shewanella algae]|uniref:hypothetical protein n=1 Tax=Shewanella algae TaxID=38313 RepID=UPI00313D0838
ASANATVWFDNCQMWNQTLTGTSTMAYCELRFPQSPAPLLLSGLLGDIAAPLHVAVGTYITGGLVSSNAINYRIARRRSAAWSAPLIGA